MQPAAGPKGEVRAPRAGLVSSLSLMLIFAGFGSPALIYMPVLFQRTGFVVPTIAIGLVAFAVRIASRVRIRSRITSCASFATSFCVLLTTAELSIQTLDNMLVSAASESCGLLFNGPSRGFSCVAASPDSRQRLLYSQSPFGNGVYSLSLGWLFCLILTVPLSLLSIKVQARVLSWSLAAALVCIVVFAAQCFVGGLSSDLLPVVANADWAVAAVLPLAIFGFSGLVTALPAWHEAKASEQGGGWGAGGSGMTDAALWCSGLMMVLFGVCGSMAFPFSADQDLLSVLINADLPSVWVATQAAAFCFAFACFLTVIPLQIQMLKGALATLFYPATVPASSSNTRHANVRSVLLHAAAVMLPFMLAPLVSAQDGLKPLLLWAGAAVLSLDMLVLPFAMALVETDPSKQRQTGSAASAGWGSSVSRKASAAGHATSLLLDTSINSAFDAAAPPLVVSSSVNIPVPLPASQFGGGGGGGSAYGDGDDEDTPSVVSVGALMAQAAAIMTSSSAKQGLLLSGPGGSASSSFKDGGHYYRENDGDTVTGDGMSSIGGGGGDGGRGKLGDKNAGRDNMLFFDGAAVTSAAPGQKHSNSSRNTKVSGTLAAFLPTDLSLPNVRGGPSSAANAKALARGEPPSSASLQKPLLLPTAMDQGQHYLDGSYYSDSESIGGADHQRGQQHPLHHASNHMLLGLGESASMVSGGSTRLPVPQLPPRHGVPMQNEGRIGRRRRLFKAGTTVVPSCCLPSRAREDDAYRLRVERRWLWVCTLGATALTVAAVTLQALQAAGTLV